MSSDKQGMEWRLKSISDAARTPLVYNTWIHSLQICPGQQSGGFLRIKKQCKQFSATHKLPLASKHTTFASSSADPRGQRQEVRNLACEAKQALSANSSRQSPPRPSSLGRCLHDAYTSTVRSSPSTSRSQLDFFRQDFHVNDSWLLVGDASGDDVTDKRENALLVRRSNEIAEPAPEVESFLTPFSTSNSTTRLFPVCSSAVQVTTESHQCQTL